MIQVRPSSSRGHSNLGWLDSRHSFSFGSYNDPENRGFRSLRVINEDRVKPGAGFGTHPHSDMEILSWVLEGGMEHRDSMGSGSVIRPGEIQRISAGTGVTHSEFNTSKTEGLHFLQIWIIPDRKGIEPSYEQKEFPLDERRGELVLVASNDGRDGSVLVHQDVSLYAARLSEGGTASHELGAGRHGYLQVTRGSVVINGHTLAAGDAVSATEEPLFDIRSVAESEFLLFNLA